MTPHRWTAMALLVIALGAGLRLTSLAAMEFKGDEQESLTLATRFIADRPWASSNHWPVYGLISSNGVGNAPIFTWIVAALWAPTHHPLGVVRAIALLNVIALYPLWQWARRRFGEWRALLTLGIVSFSPFFVLYSRKIWPPDLMLPALLAILWAVEYLRDGRAWRAAALMLVSTLFVGQLHQSGPIALALMPVALAAQWWIDRRQGTEWRWQRPTAAEGCAVVLLIAANLFLWVPYLEYFFGLPAAVFERRRTIESFSPELLRKLAFEVVPSDLFYFFEPHRYAFLDGTWRRWSYTTAVDTGWPLLVYGAWRWLRRPWSLPVLGLWWWMIVATFAAARILTQPYYVLILAPLSAVLPAGGFDPPRLPRWAIGALSAIRVAHVMSLLVLSATTVAWLAERHGAAGEYGVSFAVREQQARRLAAGTFLDVKPNTELICSGVPLEVQWLAQWRARSSPIDVTRATLCDGWVLRNGELVYEWQLRRTGDGLSQ